MKTKFNFAKALFCSMPASFMMSCSPEINNTPNIILINMDDMGYGDIGVTGAMNYNTPNIDQLANNGILFTNFYSAQPVSTASRAGLLTGCYPNRIGIHGAIMPGSKIGLNPEEETIASILGKAGYETAIVGKWHLGDNKKFWPRNFGFDYFYGLLYSNDMWPFHPTIKFPPLPLYENEEVVNDSLTSDFQAQLTTKYTEKSIDFIKKNKNNKFFLYLAHSMPHVPLYVSDKFHGKSAQGLYGDVMMELDWSIGEIIKVLKEQGLEKKTMIVFTSDNGPWLNYGNHAGSSGGLREGKCSSFEGGQRVPCIMSWPSVLPNGRVDNSLISAIDLLPTFADFAKTEPPLNKIDGMSFYDYLLNHNNKSPREYFCYYYKKNSLHAIRNRQYKLVFKHVGRTYEGFCPGIDGMPGEVDNNAIVDSALYDLRRDPGERYNIIDYYPDIINELSAAAEVVRDDIGDDLTKRIGKNRRLPGSVN